MARRGRPLENLTPSRNPRDLAKATRAQRSPSTVRLLPLASFIPHPISPCPLRNFKDLRRTPLDPFAKTSPFL